MYHFHLLKGARVVRFTGLASVLCLFCAAGAARADESVVLNLPAFPRQASPAEAAAPVESRPQVLSPKPNPAALVPSKEKPAINRRGNPRQAAENTIGRLGMAPGGATIYLKRSSRSRSLSSVPAGTYLALTREMGDWYGVLMADRSTGWLKKSAVKVLDYAVVSNEPLGAPPAGGPPAVLSGGYQAILQTAYHYLGVPYKYGGTSESAMDCSAFVQKCFSAVGINLPRTSREQVNVGMAVDPSQLQACDRLYFANRQGTITHTGIYIGDGYFIHASSSRGGVAVSRLSEPLYRRMFFGARR